MTSNEQKDIWQDEKAQQLRDKNNQPKEVKRNKVNLSFGGKKKQKPDTSPTKGTLSDKPTDDFLRKQLGI